MDCIKHYSSTNHNPASISSENLTAPITSYGGGSRLYRIPSLPKSYNKSGIPIPTIHRDLSQVALRGHFDIYVKNI